MKSKITLLILFTYALLINEVSAQNPTKWRGPEGNGNYPDTDLMDSWPEDGPEIIWSYTGLGLGHASPAIYQENIYTAGMTDSIGYIFKFDMNGKLIYKSRYGYEYTRSYVGSRGTPVIDGDRIYFVSGYGILYCMNEADGSTLWKKDMVNEFGGDTIRWGYTETPVIDGKILYATPGGKKNNVVALDKMSGAIIWSCPGLGELSAYCTPSLFEHNGREILATHTESHLLGIDAVTGKLLWTQEQPNKWSVHANTPIYYQGELFYFSGYGQGSGKLKLNADGSDVELVWNNITLDSRIGGTVLVDGYLYGSGDSNRELKCVDWKTGINQWESNDFARSVTIYADGKIFIYSDRGELAMVEADPKEYKVLAETKVTLGTEQHWAHPVIHDGVLYVRHGQTLIAYKIK